MYRLPYLVLKFWSFKRNTCSHVVGLYECPDSGDGIIFSVLSILIPDGIHLYASSTKYFVNA